MRKRFGIQPVQLPYEYWKLFVVGKDYEKHITDGKPSGKTLIVTYMDASS